MKFVHTADWQIGMKAVHLAAKAEQVRQARLTAARRVVDIANQHDVDFMVLAGDTFEHNGVARSLVREAAKILGRANCPVFIIPGNHDPAVPGSVWENPVWEEYDNVKVLRKRERVSIDGGMLFACPVMESYSSADPTEWTATQTGDGIRVAVAHGSVEGSPDQDLSHPIPRDAPARHRLDYVALGHYHSQAHYPGEDHAVRMAYSGTHEPTSFGERDSGNILLVEIHGPGAPPIISAKETAVLEWKQYHKSIKDPGDVTSLVAELEQLSAPERTLIDCVLDGVLYVEEQETTAKLQEMLQELFLFGRLDDSRLHLDMSDESWLEELPPGYIREAAKRLFENAGKEEATAAERQALREFALLWKEART